MIWLKKIKAGALQYVLVISVIIAIIVFAFISLIYLQQRMNSKHQFTKETIANTQLGFDYLKLKNIAYNSEIKLDFTDNPQATTTITKKHWGIFDLAIVTSQIKNERFKKVGLLGTQNIHKEALYLKENNQSLVLVGATKIIGNASLPKQGVKSGNISGTSYNGNQLIYGNRKLSTSSLPKIKNIDYLRTISKNYFEDAVERFELEYEMKRHHSFHENTLLYEDTNPIILENISLSGNMMLISKSKITVKSSAKLEDIILIAPKIIIESNFIGNFQAIATKNIEVKPNCFLNYPTALIVIEKEVVQSKQPTQTTKEENNILISKNSQVKGVLIFDSENKTSNYKTQINIEDKAILTGEVYCTKNLELLGTVFGSVYTNNFIVHKSGSIYINYIYNGVINVKELPNQYAGIPFNEESNIVAKWVD